MNKTTLHYGAAILAAPLFVLLYTSLFQTQQVNLDTLFHDKEALFLLLIFYPIVEELIFRGMIQEYIALKTKERSLYFHSISLANILTSLLFVALHFIYHAPLWALLVFIPSLLFGYFKEQYKNIVPSIFLHMFYNLCSLFLLVQ